MCSRSLAGVVSSAVQTARINPNYYYSLDIHLLRNTKYFTTAREHTGIMGGNCLITICGGQKPGVLSIGDADAVFCLGPLVLLQPRGNGRGKHKLFCCDNDYYIRAYTVRYDTLLSYILYILLHWSGANEGRTGNAIGNLFSAYYSIMQINKLYPIYWQHDSSLLQSNLAHIGHPLRPSPS